MKYMTPGEAAERLQVSRWTVIRWIKDGRFGDVGKGGFGATSPHKIPVTAVEAVADVLGIEPPSKEDTQS